jgi:hypothetical protein
MSDLVERVARKLASFRSTEHDWERYEQEARALTRIALEEAAKVAESHRGTWEEEEAAAKRIAAAIRAMIPSGNDPARDDTGNAE